MISSKRRLFTALGILGLVMLTGSLIFYFTSLDLDVASWFYDSSLPKGFDRKIKPWYYIAKFGEFCPHVCCGAAILVWLAGLFWKKAAPWRRKALFVWLLVLLGPAMMVNLVMKPIFRRPRPSQILEYRPSAEEHYVKVFHIGHSGSNSSLPSGHAAGAFSMIFPFFLLYATRRRWAYAALAGGTIWGVLMSFCRIIQGRHFLSDVFWAAGVVVFFCVILDYFVKPSASADASECASAGTDLESDSSPA